jgi:uncharacterized protein (DUF1684 family)
VTVHRAEVEAWRAGRYERLRNEVGWLTLAGLDWLREGVNRVGSDPGSDVVLPGGPPDAGIIRVEDGAATASGRFTRNGEAVDDLRLDDDHDGQPTLLEVGPLRLCVIERGGRLAVRTWDTDAPQRREFTGIDHWPVDPRWRLDARLVPGTESEVHVPDILGTVEAKRSPSVVEFTVEGLPYRLQALEGGPNGELWLVFGDATNGGETYGGGRFLYTDAPDADGHLIVDFNRAYNPPCVFSPYATCPLPWPANRLPIRVEAGERAYRAP